MVRRFTFVCVLSLLHGGVKLAPEPSAPRAALREAADDDFDIEPDDLPEYDLRDEFDEMPRPFSRAHFAQDPPDPFVRDFATTQDEPERNVERCT